VGLPKRPGKGGPKFADVAARFIAEKQRDPSSALTAQTIGQYEAAFRLFDSFARQPTLGDIDRRMASEFLDKIATLDPHWGRSPETKKRSFAEIMTTYGSSTRGLTNKTINRFAMALGMVWRFAEDRDGYEGVNPWSRQARSTGKRRGTGKTDKRAFTPSELRKLLKQKPEVAPDKHDTASALPWITLIGAYSGMRLNEICSLDVEDVKKNGDVWFFDITAAKTEAGMRCVPVHSRILQAGFLDYRKRIKCGQLFPGLKPGGPDDKLGWYASKRFTEVRRGLSIEDIKELTGRDQIDFHSLRRSASTALKHARIPEHEAAEILGHEHPQVTFGVYPDRHKLVELQRIIEAIRYEGIDR
jgi:integrase